MSEAHDAVGRVPIELFWLGCAAAGFLLTVSGAFLLSVTAGVL